MDTDDEEVYLHFSDAFIYSGRVTNVKRLLSFHPLYLDAFMNTESYVMDGEGPLPFDWRYYIGILVTMLKVIVMFPWILNALHSHMTFCMKVLHYKYDIFVMSL